MARSNVDVLLDMSGEPGEEGEAWEAYLRLCTKYLQRQMIVYKNWPQRRFDHLGYRDEKVFKDMNA